MIIGENIKKIKNGLGEAEFIAVSKTKPLELLKEAYDEGIRDFGENKVQELIDKVPNMPSDVRWHLIGHLQTNKVKYIVGKVYLIHSLDSIKLLEELEKRYKQKGLQVSVLIQINIGKEESKTGIYEEELYELLDKIQECECVKVKGLMTVIPKGNEEECKFYFRKMKKIFDSLKEENIKNVDMKYLSMGMSRDYKWALEEGANIVRIGEGIFGKR